ncbi:MAG: hypothetical protein ACO1N9_00390 [Flavobacterium sp.]
MKKICLILFVLLSLNMTAQEPCSKGSRIPTPEKQFTADAANNNVRLYILGGFVPAVTEADRKFEEKYSVRFHDFGCTPPPLDYYKEYNVLAFAYLKEKYGDAWEKEIKPNVLGWDVFKAKNH